MFVNFAGLSISTGYVISIGILALITVSILVGAVIYTFRRIVYKSLHKNDTKSVLLSLASSFIIGFCITAATILLFLVLPTFAKDKSWDHKQRACAREVGYTNPSDNNSNNATATSQKAYMDCLER